MSRATANISATANTMVKKSVVQIIATTNNIEEIRIVTEAIIPSALTCVPTLVLPLGAFHDSPSFGGPLKLDEPPKLGEIVCIEVPAAGIIIRGLVILISGRKDFPIHRCSANCLNPGLS